MAVIRVAADHRGPARGGLAGEREHGCRVDARAGPGGAAEEEAQEHDPASQGPLAGPGPGEAGLPCGAGQHPSGTGMALRFTPVRGSSTWLRCWIWPRGGFVGFALGERRDAQLAYGALAMAVAVRGGQALGGVPHRLGQRRGGGGGTAKPGAPRGGPRAGRRTPPGWSASACAPAGHLPVDGAPWLRAGQRGHRVLAFDPGVRAARPGALRHQGASAHPDPGVDRRLQPPPAAFSAAVMSPVD